VDFPYARVQFDCLKQGLLRRKEKHQSWAVRWFVLYHNAVFAYKPHTPEPKPDAVPQLVVPLSAISHEKRHAMRVWTHGQAGSHHSLSLGSAGEQDFREPTVTLESDLGHVIVLQAVLEGDTEPLDVWVSAIVQQAIRVERAMLRAKSARQIYDHLNRSRSARIAPSPLQSSAPDSTSPRGFDKFTWQLARPTRRDTFKRGASRRVSSESTSSSMVNSSTKPPRRLSDDQKRTASQVVSPGTSGTTSSPHLPSLRGSDAVFAARSSPLLPRTVVPLWKTSEEPYSPLLFFILITILFSSSSSRPAKAANVVTMTDFLSQEPPKARRMMFSFGQTDSMRQLQTAKDSSGDEAKDLASSTGEVTGGGSSSSPSANGLRMLYRRPAQRALVSTLSENLSTPSDDDGGLNLSGGATSSGEAMLSTLQSDDQEGLGPLLDYLSLPKLPDVPVCLPCS